MLNGHHVGFPLSRTSILLQDAAGGGALKSAKDVLDKVMGAWQLPQACALQLAERAPQQRQGDFDASQRRLS